MPTVLKVRGGGEQKEVEAETVEMRVLSPTILASGTLTYQTEVKLVPEIIGRVKELLIKEGDTVAKGDLLLRLDPAAQLAQVAQLEATVAQSRLNIERQKVTVATQATKFKRYQSLRAQGVDRRQHLRRGGIDQRARAGRAEDDVRRIAADRGAAASGARESREDRSARADLRPRHGAVHQARRDRRAQRSPASPVRTS